MAKQKNQLFLLETPKIYIKQEVSVSYSDMFWALDVVECQVIFPSICIFLFSKSQSLG